MSFFYNINQTLRIPELTNRFNLTSDSFVIRKRFDGGMGTCYQIEDCDGKVYALKVIHSDLITDENSYNRYFEEIKLWKTFSACNGVAEALHIVKVNDIPCVVSTWMESGDMRPLLSKMDIKTFIHTMDRIITTLKWVYDNYKVIHRDLKPGNILIDKDKKAYVADWGLAKIISKGFDSVKTGSANNDDVNKTQAGQFVGTVLYASPEQLMGSPKIDHRSDIYSIGCMMYEWETGRPPFMANTIHEIASAHIYTKPKKLGGLFKSTNFKAEHIIAKCLEKRPEDRYQTYDELLVDLHKVAKKYISDFEAYKVKERYLPINIGHGEFEKRLKEKQLGIVGNKGFGIISEEDVTPYLDEAIDLCALRQFDKAISIYKRLFVKDIIEEFPDFGYHQLVAINLAQAYSNIKEYDKALETILAISSAVTKPAEYYVNLSYVYMCLSKFQECANICNEGLKSYPNDIDLLGNYTTSLTVLKRFDEAIKSAEKRLDLNRDIHSISEFAHVVYSYAESIKNKDFSNAIKFYQRAFSLYKDALVLNPRYDVAQYNISLLLFKMKRYSDSLSYGKEMSISSKGTSEVNAFYAARNMLWMGEYKTGLEFCDKFLKVYPNSIMLKRVRAQILVDGYVLNNYNKDGNRIIERSSLEFFTNIIKDPVNRLESDVIYLSKIHFWMGDSKEIKYAFDLLEWGKTKYPEYWKFNFYIASYSFNCKHLDRATEEGLECLKKAPCREYVYNLLAKIYTAKGDNMMSAKMQTEFDRLGKMKKQLYESCKQLTV